MARTRHVELFQSRFHPPAWHWRLVEANGERFLPSRAYATQASARRAALRKHPGIEIRVVP